MNTEHACKHGNHKECARPETSGSPTPLALTVNGKPVEAIIPADLLLIDFLRENLGLTGTKRGCGEGDCGACTVLLDGKSMTSCLVLALQAQGKEVLTVEGLMQGNELHPIQEAFLEAGAVQCGFCTPGMLLMAKELLEENARPSRAEIMAQLAGNLCRCTGYAKIAQAVDLAARRMQVSK